MPESVDTVVIGAGQAGLATSYHLARLGREHVVLERGEVANTWRTERWDGFYLNTPRWTQALPGHEYDGPDPEASPRWTRRLPTSTRTQLPSQHLSARTSRSRACN
jgi:cation diffusion facilitator CzcD-associated flavoprotein CzcO